MQGTLAHAVFYSFNVMLLSHLQGLTTYYSSNCDVDDAELIKKFMQSKVYTSPLNVAYLPSMYIALHNGCLFCL